MASVLHESRGSVVEYLVFCFWVISVLSIGLLPSLVDKDEDLCALLEYISCQIFTYIVFFDKNISLI